MEIAKSTKKYELGFVFGSSLTLRIEKAVELKHKNLISKILICGHNPF